MQNFDNWKNWRYNISLDGYSFIIIIYMTVCQEAQWQVIWKDSKLILMPAQLIKPSTFDSNV